MKWMTRNATGPTPTITRENDEIRIDATITSSRVDEYGDRILDTALERWLRLRRNAGPLPMLHEHDRTRVAGLWDGFELVEDESDGALLLKASGVVLPAFHAGKEAALLLEHEFINCTSIGAFVGQISRDPGSNVWNIGSIDIKEASLVMWPGNLDATIDRTDSIERDVYSAFDRILKEAA